MRAVPSDCDFSPALSALARIDFDYDGGYGYDYEPYEKFMTAQETNDWIRAWTGNPELDGGQYRVFGQDGTGGLAALWLIRSGVGLVEQPVVFFGSEGDLGVVARDLGDFLWLLADGVGPLEAVERDSIRSEPNAELRAVAEEFAPGRGRTAEDVLTAVRAEFPDFEEDFARQCKAWASYQTR